MFLRKVICNSRKSKIATCHSYYKSNGKMKKINVGIDLGTTYSAVAVFSQQTNRVEVLKNSLGKETTPSVICIENGNILIGEEAKDEQKSGNINTAAFYKSMMSNTSYSAYIDGSEFSAEDLSGLFLTELKKDIERANDVTIESAVITVPAYFDDKQREATIRAGQKAGLRVLKIINEPTAAIIAYGLTGDKNKNVMVYDLGGGTFDVTVAHIEGTSISVTATNGNHQLGGMNWDDILINEITDQFYSEFGVDIRSHSDDFKELQVKCEEAKKRLSSVTTTLIPASCEGNSGKYEVTREMFDDRTESLLNETFSLVNKCFEEISSQQKRSFGWKDIDEVVLVGGSTRMPQVKERILKEYGKAPVTKDINVDTIVATGAAMQAELCINNVITLMGPKKNGSNQSMCLTIRNSDIQDITAHSLGLLATSTISETEIKFINSIILEKNSKIGIAKEKEYHVTSESTEIYVLQGESENPYECSLLDKYVLSNLKKGTMNDFSVAFLYNQNGVVEVTAKDSNGKPLSVQRVSLSEPLNAICNTLENEYKKAMNTPYTQWAGISNIPSTTTDKYGNPQGGQFDLAKDGAFKGYQIIVLNFGNDGSDTDDKIMEKPEIALRRKGFTVKEYCETPAYLSLKNILSAPDSQLWVISGVQRHINDQCLELIYEYYQKGHGIYLWGDNDPWYVDANVILNRLFGTCMDGNLPGNKVLSIQHGAGQPGIIENHPITTGLVNFFEGITIANVHTKNGLNPLVYGSDRCVVTAYYDDNGRRVLADGGYTRLYCNWDSAGTDRYIVNAAAWLANVERFGYNRDQKLKSSNFLGNKFKF